MEETHGGLCCVLCAPFIQWHRAMVCEGCSDWDIFSWEMSGSILLELGEEKGSFSWLAWILQVYLYSQPPLPSLISVASRLGGLELLQALEGSFLGVFTCSPTSPFLCWWLHPSPLWPCWVQDHQGTGTSLLPLNVKAQEEILRISAGARIQLEKTSVFPL